MALLCDVEGIDQCRDVDVPCVPRIKFSLCRKQCYEIEDGVYLVFLHGVRILDEVARIELQRRAVFRYLFHKVVAQVCSDDIVISVNFLQVRNQFGSDLSARADNQYSLHVPNGILICYTKVIFL